MDRVTRAVPHKNVTYVPPLSQAFELQPKAARTPPKMRGGVLYDNIHALSRERLALNKQKPARAGVCFYIQIFRGPARAHF